jgi:hypothetical protein
MSEHTMRANQQGQYPGATLVAINHSPITHHMLVCLAAEGRINLDATVVVNTRGANFSLPARDQLTAPLSELRTTQLALEWIANHLADITRCHVLVPQTQEPFYAALAAVGASFDYIEEGVGTHTFLSLFAHRNALAILAARLKAFIKASARAIEVTRRACYGKSNRLETELARLFVRRPICTFMDVRRARRIFTFSEWKLRNVVCVDFASGIQAETSASARGPLRAGALILLPPRELGDEERDLLKMYLRDANITRALLKYHPASPTKQAFSAHLPDVALEELPSAWNMHEPIVLCAAHKIDFLVHFGSSAGLYAPILNNSMDRKVVELNVSEHSTRSVPRLNGGIS